MRVAILPNLTRLNAKEVTESICRFMKNHSVECSFEKEYEGVFSPDCLYLEDGELFSGCDIIIAVGGDGSIIHAAKQALDYSKPILGVNAGNLAFMAGLESNETELLKNLIDGNYKVDKRMLLDVSVYDGGGKLISQNTCINDVVIARSEMIKMIRLNVSCDKDRINEYYADGIIVSTPTGTTAYSLSAGGPVVDPRIESIVLTPICTHSLFARSIILGSGSEVCVEVPADETQKVAVSCDGDDSLIIGANSRVIIRKSESFASFIRIKNDSFIDVLNSKLAQRRM